MALLDPSGSDVFHAASYLRPPESDLATHRDTLTKVHSSLLESLDKSLPPLRIGLLVDSRTLPRIFAEITNQIVGCDFARIELIIVNSGVGEGAQAPLPANRSRLRVLYDSLAIPRLRRRFLYTLYEKWDARGSDPAIDPTADVDCADRLIGVESLDVVPISKGFVHRFPPDAIAQIRAKNLDVIIRFGFNILRGEILQCARHGVWSYHHGDNDYYRGGPPYFWEMLERNTVSGAILQVLNEELDGGHVLAKGYFSTVPGVSQVKNRLAPYWGSSTFMIQKLRELHGRGWEYVAKRSVGHTAYLGKKKIYRSPSNWEMARWVASEFVTKSVQKIKSEEKDGFWRPAVRAHSTPLSESPNTEGFDWLDCPDGHFYADPFLIEDKGKLWLFLEDYCYKAGIGKIICGEFRDGKLGAVTPVLERPHHLSYPCVFRHGETFYMVPETGANSTVELHRAVDFPYKWELVRVLYNGPAVDTTVWQQGGVWYFFSTLFDRRGGGSQLWLFCADSPDGDWRPHPASPIATDVRSNRGAGAIFEHNGRLFRPSQDCSVLYGHSFTLNEILVLNPDDYQERPHTTVGPTWAKNLVGTHSYAQFGPYEIIDGCEFIPAGSRGRR